MRSTWFFWFRNMFLPSHGKSFISQSAATQGFNQMFNQQLRDSVFRQGRNHMKIERSERCFKPLPPETIKGHCHLLWQSYTWSHLITFDPSFLSATARISLLKRSASFCAILRNGGWWEQRFKRDSKREAVPIWIGVPQKWIVYTGKPYYPIDDLGVPLIRIDDLGAHPYFWKHPNIFPRASIFDFPRIYEPATTAAGVVTIVPDGRGRIFGHRRHWKVILPPDLICTHLGISQEPTWMVQTGGQRCSSKNWHQKKYR